MAKPRIVLYNPAAPFYTMPLGLVAIGSAVDRSRYDVTVVDVDAGKRALIEGFRFYQRIGWAKPTRWRRPIQAVARWRCRRDLYTFPIEKVIAQWMRPALAS